MVNFGSKYAFFNKNGTIIISPKFETVSSFSERLTLVEIDDKWGYIDKSGEVVIAPQFDDAYYFTNGLTRVKTSS